MSFVNHQTSNVAYIENILQIDIDYLLFAVLSITCRPCHPALHA